MADQSKDIHLSRAVFWAICIISCVCQLTSPSDISGAFGNIAVFKIPFYTTARFYWSADWYEVTCSVQPWVNQDVRIELSPTTFVWMVNNELMNTDLQWHSPTSSWVHCRCSMLEYMRLWLQTLKHDFRATDTCFHGSF